MKRFIAAFFVLQLLKFLVGLSMQWGWLGQPGINVWERVPITVVLPTVVAWLVALAMNRVQPRRVFDSRVKQPLTQFMFGAMAGLLNAVIGALSTMVLKDLTMDLLALVIAAAATACAVIVSIPRKRPGRCVQCGANYVPGETRCLNCFAEKSQAAAGSAETLAG
ncbi:MAG: hypothetical protein WC718_08100 [Phycisphaerales bacterium]|jgi:hypothetical protein